VVIPGIYADPRVPQGAYRPTSVRSMAMVPVAKGTAVGAIGAYWASAHVADETELRTLTTLADAASLAMAAAALFRRTAGRSQARAQGGARARREESRGECVAAHDTIRSPATGPQAIVPLKDARGGRRPVSEARTDQFCVSWFGPAFATIAS
jgi:hypothetical protein